MLPALFAAVARRLTAPVRCEHPGCRAAATEYDPLLDLRTCLAHQPGQDEVDLPVILDLRVIRRDRTPQPSPVEQP